MASWDSIAKEVSDINRPDAYDIVRRQKIDAVQQRTGRHLVIYAADFTNPNPIKAQVVANLVVLSLQDKDGFDEVTRNLPQDSNLDVLLHSPGGSAEATESIVELLRARFSHIRFIIPSVAKSAATMMAMSGNQLVMDERSELGPTDPQMLMSRDGQLIMAPAQAIKDQFQTAQEEVNRDPTKLPSWVPILREYGPALLAQCDNQMALSHRLVSQWLARYMFAGDPHGQQKAERVSKYLSDHNNFLSHARRVGINDLTPLGVNILDMRSDPALHEAVRDLYTAIMLTFGNTGAFKMFENDKHEALIQAAQVQVASAPPAGLQQPAPQQPPSRPSIPPRNKVQERRDRQKGNR